MKNTQRGKHAPGLERRLLHLAHRLKERGRKASLLYLDEFQGDLIGLSVMSKGGNLGLHADRRTKPTRLVLLATTSAGPQSLFTDLAGLQKELPRKQLNARRFVQKVRKLSDELARTFDERADSFPREQIDRFRGVFPEALPATGLIVGSRSRRNSSSGAGTSRTTVHGAFVPAGEVGVFALFDVENGGFRFSAGATTLVASTLSAHPVTALVNFGILLDDETALERQGDFVDNVAVGVGAAVVETAADVAAGTVDAALSVVDLGVVDGWDCGPGLDCVPDCGCDVPCL